MKELTLQEINIDEIKINEQPRKLFDKEKIKLLAGSFENGQPDNPPTIDKNNNLITGERRVRAMKELGTKHIRVLVGKPENVLIHQLKENSARIPLTPLEQLEGIKNLILSVEKTILNDALPTKERRQKIIKTVAQRIGISEHWINKLLKFDSAPEALKQKVKDHYATKKEKGISISKAIEILELEKPEEKEINLIAEEVIKEGLGRNAVREEIKLRNQLKNSKLSPKVKKAIIKKRITRETANKFLEEGQDWDTTTQEHILSIAEAKSPTEIKKHILTKNEVEKAERMHRDYKKREEERKSKINGLGLTIKMCEELQHAIERLVFVQQMLAEYNTPKYNPLNAKSRRMILEQCKRLLSSLEDTEKSVRNIINETKIIEDKSTE